MMKNNNLKNNILNISDEILDYLLSYKKENPDFTFSLRTRDSVASKEERLSQGQWFQGSDYIYVPLFKKGDNDRKIKTIGFVLTFSNSGEVTDNYIEISFRGGSYSTNEINFHNDLAAQIGLDLNGNRFGSLKYEEPKAYMNNLKDFITSTRAQCIELLHKYNLTSQYIITDKEFYRTLDRIMKIRNNLQRIDATGQGKSIVAGNLNLILYGPPGTGKTYNSINNALEIIGISTQDKTRDEIKEIYNEKVLQGKIAFTTFHQSMSYEDFIEGIKPKTTKDGGVNYAIESGIFKSISNRALQNLVIENKTDTKINGQLTFDDLHELFLKDIEKYKGTKNPCFSTIYGHDILLIDIKGSSVIVRFVWQDTKKTIPATQPFSVTKDKLKQLFDAEIIPSEIKSLKETFAPFFKHNLSVYYAVYKTFYDFVLKNTNQEQLETIEVDSDYTFEELKAEWDLLDITIQKKKVEKSEKYVLIIDEINRGNVSQIFGELITLIEDDKRFTKDESLEVILPYSKKQFGVAPNLYILGTMNTADRSIEALDTALRRRFQFSEVLPQAELLDPNLILQRLWMKYATLEWTDPKWQSIEADFLKLHNATIINREVYENLENQNDLNLLPSLFANVIEYKGINLCGLLNTINSRIEKLLDKDHKIGHSYFMNVFSIEDLKQTFSKNVIPLLQEYFYGDYGKIGMILGEEFFEDNKAEGNVTFKSFFDYPSDELAEKSIYRLKNVNKMKNPDFLNAVISIT